MGRKRPPEGDDGLQAYFEQIGSIPLLSFEEELDLSRRIQQGDETARRRLIEANLKLVIKIARTYLASDIALMDLIQEGNMGLMRAADKYDHNRQLRFSTYATWWIRQSITRYLSDKRRTIRLPHRKEEVLRKIQKAYYTLSQLYMRQPKIEEIAADTGVSRKDVKFLLGLSSNFLLVESDGRNMEGTTVIELHEDYTYSPERALIRKSSREATLRVLEHLRDHEKNVLIDRYQLKGGRQHTLKKIGVKMGLSAETVRQIELRALEKLRGHAEDLQAYIEA